MIGNASYGTSPLRNPANDAEDMTIVLKELGFKVTTLIDASHQEMYQAIRDFGKSISRADAGLFYFAGHGMQVDGVNYLIPVGADVQSEEEVKFNAIDANLVLAKMEQAKSRTNILLLDSCRDNPFTRSFRSSSRGLAIMDAPSGSLVVYATAPGSVAADGQGKNGIFTGAMLRHLKTPGVDVEAMLRQVRKEVMAETGNQQVPWSSSSLTDSFYFAGDGHNGSPSIAADKSVSSLESEVKTAGRDSNGFVLVEAGTFRMGSDNENSSSSVKPTHRVVITRAFYMAKYETTVAKFRQFVGETGHRTTAEVMGAYVWTGQTSMQRKLDANWRNPYLSVGQTDSHPVVGVGWKDAVEYCNWRSIKEGLNPAYSGTFPNIRCDFTANGYRLPTEAEWEYVARGGSLSLGHTYAGSNTPEEVAWFRDNAGETTRIVGTKKPNELELYDMIGNAQEWCWDLYGDYSAATLINPRGATDSKKYKSMRVVRGGSFASLAPDVFTRAGGDSFIGFNTTGFRVVRTGD